MTWTWCCHLSYFVSATVYHNIESKFKRTTLHMKKQNKGTDDFLNASVHLSFTSFYIGNRQTCQTWSHKVYLSGNWRNKFVLVASRQNESFQGPGSWNDDESVARCCCCSSRLWPSLPPSCHHAVQAHRHPGLVLQGGRLRQPAQHNQGPLQRIGQSGEGFEVQCVVVKMKRIQFLVSLSSSACRWATVAFAHWLPRCFNSESASLYRTKLIHWKSKRTQNVT